MLLLTNLVANVRSISNLEGLQYATNLLNAEICSNEISTISPSVFSGLTKLEVLHLGDNETPIPDLAFSELTNLVDLSLSSNEIRVIL